MSRMKKPIKKGRLPGRPEHYRTPIAYISVPIMSMQKRRNRKTIYRHIKQPNQKRNSFAFGFSSLKTFILTIFLRNFNMNANEIELQDATRQIENMHGVVTDGVRVVFENAINIGEILCQQKKKLPHGEFTKWVDGNLPFTMRAAQNYMKLFANKDMLINANVSHLGQAYKLLTEPKQTDNNLEKLLFDGYKELEFEQGLQPLIDKYFYHGEPEIFVYNYLPHIRKQILSIISIHVDNSKTGVKLKKSVIEQARQEQLDTYQKCLLYIERCLQKYRLPNGYVTDVMMSAIVTHGLFLRVLFTMNFVE